MEEELADLVCGVDDVDPQTASAFLSSVDNTMLDVEVTLPRKAWEEFYTLKKSTVSTSLIPTCHRPLPGWTCHLTSRGVQS